MNLVDGAIIYLTFGAPIAMYGVFHKRRRPGFLHLLKFGSAFFIWPVSLALIVSRQLSLPKAVHNNKTRIPLKIDIRSRERSLAKTIARLVDSSLTVEYRKQIGEAAERYACLKVGGIVEDPELTPIHEVYKLAGHPNASLASKCITRRNNLRLQRHIAAAKTDLLTTLALLPDEAFYDRSCTAKRSARLAVLLNDRDISDEIKAIFQTRVI